VIKLKIPEDNEKIKKCPVCQAEYGTFEEATACMVKYGSTKNKFSAGQVVIVIEGINKGLIGEIKLISFAKPGNPTRPTHSSLYLIKVEKAKSGNGPLPNFTTALENEITIYQET